MITHDLAGNRSSEVSNQPITAPVITGQPQTLLGQIGGAYAFSVTASGPNLNYQWYKDTTAISGATSDTLIINNAVSGDFSNHSSMTGMYSVVVSNTAGSVTSNSVALYLDSDGIGIPDWWQQQYFGTVGINPAATPNNNGITNLQAYQEGLNPTSAATEGYALTVSGPVSVQPRQASYAPGSTVTLSVPNGMLLRWAGDANGNANPLTVTMNSSKSIQALTTSYPNTHFGATLSLMGDGSGVSTLLVQANGQVMVGGTFDTFLGSPQWNLGRINANGTLDTGVCPGTQNGFTSASSANIYDMAQQPDGKVVVVGNFNYTSPTTGAPPNYIARFNTDGSLDDSFMANGQYPNGRVTAVAVQSDGHIIIAGNFSQIGSAYAYNIARLNSDGSLDTTFGVGTSGTTSYNDLDGSVPPGCLQVDSSNNIYVGGSFSYYNGTNTLSNLMRLTSVGVLDTTFSTGSGFNNSVTCFAQRPSGGLYVGGNFTAYQGATAESMVALTSTGSIDTSFNAGSGASGAPTQIVIQPSGELLVALNNGSWQGQFKGYVIELTAAGSLDSSFTSNISSVVSKMALLNNGTGDVLIGGSFTSVGGQPRGGLAELTSSGSLDTSAPVWNVGTAVGNTIGSAAQQPDGKLLVDGYFSLVDNTVPASYSADTNPYSFIRLNADGSLDNTFNPGSGPNQPALGILPLSTGQAILYGRFTSYNGTSAANCIRIQNNGSLDTTFTGGAAGGIFSAAMQSTGDIIVATLSAPYIQRLTPDGTLDSTFHSPAITSLYIRTVAVDSQDRILIGGDFTALDGQSIPYLARLNSDGTVDSTFTPPAPNNSVLQVALSMTTGEIVARGYFSAIGSTSQNSLASFSSTGSLNPLPGEQPSTAPATIGVQSNGGIIVGNSSGSSPLYRISPAGTLDTTFEPGVNNSVQTIAIGTNDDIYALGSFTTDASQYASGIAHYSTSPHLSLAIAGTIPTGTVTAGTPITLYGTASTTSGSITSANFLYSTDGINYMPASAGAPAGGGEWTGIWAPPAAGTYYLRLEASDTTGESGQSPVFTYTAISGSPQISTPALSVTTGTYSGSQFVNVSDTTPGVQVFYTLDGSNPATSSTRIFLGTGGIIPVSQSASLNVEAFYGSGSSSSISASYTINSSLLAGPTGAPAYYPNWWFTRGIINQTGTPVPSPVWPTNYPAADDFAVINQGQLKNLATQAYNELTSVLPPSAWSTPQGQTLSSLVSGLSPTGGDAYAVVNMGQLKTVAQPFYDLLKQQSMVNGYPWTGVGADDYSVTNIGQAKNVFNSIIP